MPAKRKSRCPTDIAPTERRDEIIAIVAAALARLIQADRSPVIPRADTLSLPARLP